MSLECIKIDIIFWLFLFKHYIKCTISDLIFAVYSEIAIPKGYSSLLSFTVTDINNTVTKLMDLGAEMDGPIKYEVHGKVTIAPFYHCSTSVNCILKP